MRLLLTKLQNNINVHSAETISRTKTRQSATRTRFMCALIRGHALHSPDTMRSFTILPTDLVKLTPAVTAVMNSHDLGAALVRVP